MEHKNERMFSGIVELLGKIEEIEQIEGNISLWISSDFNHELKIDQSISHNGICLTVDKIKEQWYRVTAIDETIKKTTIQDWKQGEYVNLERCIRLSDRLDGHIVQGHIDTTGLCTHREGKNGSWEFIIEFPEEFTHLVIEKGSIAIDGTSLTCHNLTQNSLQVSIIPYTYHHTVSQYWQIGKKVNLEFDILGKYLHRQRITS